MGLDTQFDEDGEDDGPAGGDNASVEIVKVSSPAGSRDIDDHSRTGHSQNKSAGPGKKLQDSSKKSQHAGINVI